MTMTTAALAKTVGVVLRIIGIWLLASIDWRIAIGVACYEMGAFISDHAMEISR